MINWLSWFSMSPWFYFGFFSFIYRWMCLKQINWFLFGSFDSFASRAWEKGPQHGATAFKLKLYFNHSHILNPHRKLLLSHSTIEFITAVSALSSTHILHCFFHQSRIGQQLDYPTFSIRIFAYTASWTLNAEYIQHHHSIIITYVYGVRVYVFTWCVMRRVQNTENTLTVVTFVVAINMNK